MRYFTLLLLLLASSLFPDEGFPQITEKATLSGMSRATVLPGSYPQDDPPVERNYTLELLQSPEGRQALARFAEQNERTRRFSARQSPYSVGDQETFFVRNPQEISDQPVFDEVEFELRREGENVELWVEIDELAEDRISENILDVIMNGLIGETPQNSINPEMGVIEIAREIYGEQPNVDGTGVVKILIADIADGYDPPEQNVFTAGFFDPVNLLPQETFPNSNFADIIYINSTPGIYREGAGIVHSRLNTIAHEFQHLIYSNYTPPFDPDDPTALDLPIFVNEGQSELAEILTGFSARGMTFLNSGSELSGNVNEEEGWIYRFRSGNPDVVLYDYQRAQLFHSYLEERTSPEIAGSLTRLQADSEGNPDQAYGLALAEAEISLPEFLSDFYLSAYGANRIEGSGIHGFSRPQLSNIRATHPGQIYNAGIEPVVQNRQEEIYYGGSLYTQWFGIDELFLEIESAEGVFHTVLYRSPGEETYQLEEIGEGGSFSLEPSADAASYEEVVLISTNTEPTGTTLRPADSRTFMYSGEWSYSGLSLEELAYHGERNLVLQIPRGDGLNALALRFSPTFSSEVNNIRFNINRHENAIQGSGGLNLRLRGALSPSENPAGELYLPGEILAEQLVEVNDLAPGENYISVNSEEWQVEEGVEYFVSMEVERDAGDLSIELLLDGGTTNTTDPDYNPARTLGLVQENGEIINFTTFECPATASCSGERNNALLAVNLVGLRDPGDLPDPDPTEPVVDFQLDSNYPNPFRAATTIEYAVPLTADVEITLHDILGRKVAELVNEVRTANTYTLEVDAAGLGLASGIYFYRMKARGVDEGESFSRVRPLTVIR